MKLKILPSTPWSDIAPFLAPVLKYGEEKARNNMQDDWDEYEHTKGWLEKYLAQGDGQLDVYYIKEKGEVIASVFILQDSQQFAAGLKNNGVEISAQRIAQLTCFHVMEAHRGRGLGRKWLEEEVFQDLKEQGIQEVYIRSSHHRALRLYDKLGSRVGTYVGVSDHQLYERLGYIFKIIL